MKHLKIYLSILAFFYGICIQTNVFAQQIKTISSLSYDYELSPSSLEAVDQPSIKINLYDRSNAVVGQLSFYKRNDFLKKATSIIETKRDPIYNVSYEFNMFNYFLTILESGKKINIEYDTKSGQACVKTIKTRAGASNNNLSNSGVSSKTLGSSKSKSLKKADLLKK